MGNYQAALQDLHHSMLQVVNSKILPKTNGSSIIAIFGPLWSKCSPSLWYAPFTVSTTYDSWQFWMNAVSERPTPLYYRLLTYPDILNDGSHISDTFYSLTSHFFRTFCTSNDRFSDCIESIELRGMMIIFNRSSSVGITTMFEPTYCLVWVLMCLTTIIYSDFILR